MNNKKKDINMSLFSSSSYSPWLQIKRTGGYKFSFIQPAICPSQKHQPAKRYPQEIYIVNVLGKIQ